MKLVKHLLDSKGHDVISVAPDLSVFDAIKLMADKLVGSLLVMNDEELRGIVTERDYARKVIIKGRSSETTSVSEIMSTEVLTTSSVIEDNRVIGMISIGDLVQAIIADQQEEIEQLESYISG